MRKLKSMVRGFTLIELLIVLAVIAALLSIISPFALGAIRQANATKVAATMRNIAVAAESWLLANRPSSNPNQFLNTLVTDGYLSRNPGNDYNVTVDLANSQLTVEYSSSDSKLLELVEKALEVSFPADDVNSGNNKVTLTYKFSKWW